MAESARTTLIPDLIIVDGGRGQLSSACKELQRFGLHEAQVIGAQGGRQEGESKT